MSQQEKINLLEEIMEIDEGTLSLDDILEDYDEWDSVTALSLIALMDERFGKIIAGEDIKKLKTVSDVLMLME